ncbi:MAG: phospholipid carrier-dependent glycosyltransferase [Motilibacteraceae bacterium]
MTDQLSGPASIPLHERFGQHDPLRERPLDSRPLTVRDGADVDLRTPPRDGGRHQVGVPGSPDGPPSRRQVVGAVLTAVTVLAVTVVVWVVHARGMYVSPIRFDDEGTYVSQAQSLLDQGRLSPYTYWYDHPPFGWMILAGWLAVPWFPEHAPNLIGQGRQLMLLLDVVSVLLTFALTRRVGGSRAAAAVAGLLMGLSPLALQFHRMVLLDNIAVPLVLGAFVLVLSPRRRLSAALAAGLAVSAAALSKETSILLLPFVAWSLWQHAKGPTRRMCMAVFTIGVVTPLVLYPLFALVKGEVLPGTSHVSLIGGIVFQLFGRTSSGSVFDPTSDARSVLDGWLTVDPYLVPIGAAAAVVALLAPLRRLRGVRPVAAALVFSVLMLLRPGYLPVPYVVALLPLAAIAVAVVLDAVVRTAAARVPDLVGPRMSTARRAAGAASAAALAAVVVLVTAGAATAAPHWYYRDRAAERVDFDRPYQQSTAYVEKRLPKTARLVVDNVTWTDLHDDGWPMRNLIWFSKLDTDPDVDRTVKSWHQLDYVVASQIMTTSRDAGPTLQAVLKHSHVVASWGQGDQRIELRKVDR